MMIMVIDDLQLKNEDDSQLQNNNAHDHPQHDIDHDHL